MLIHIEDDSDLAQDIKQLSSELNMGTTDVLRAVMWVYRYRKREGFPTVRERLEALENGQRNIKARLRKLEHQGSERYGIHYLVEGNDGT